MCRLEDHFITTAQQQLLIDEYQEKNYAIINENRPANNPDSHMYTYKLDLLIKYMEYVKTESIDLGLQNVKIKICMGQYPENDFDSRLNPAYGGRQTIFFRAESETGEPIERISALDLGDSSPP